MGLILNLDNFDMNVELVRSRKVINHASDRKLNLKKVPMVHLKINYSNRILEKPYIKIY